MLQSFFSSFPCGIFLKQVTAWSTKTLYCLSFGWSATTLYCLSFGFSLYWVQGGSFYMIRPLILTVLWCEFQDDLVMSHKTSFQHQLTDRYSVNEIVWIDIHISNLQRQIIYVRKSSFFFIILSKMCTKKRLPEKKTIFFVPALNNCQTNLLNVFVWNSFTHPCQKCCSYKT